LLLELVIGFEPVRLHVDIAHLDMLGQHDSDGRRLVTQLAAVFEGEPDRIGMRHAALDRLTDGGVCYSGAGAGWIVFLAGSVHEKTRVHHPPRRRCGGVAAGGRAQQDGRVRRIGWLIGGTEFDTGMRAQVAALREGLAKLGWVEGRNLYIDMRYGAGSVDRIRAAAADLVRLAPDVIVSNTGAGTIALQPQTRTIPIVFASGGDPTANGLIQNIARPEGNITGFSTTEPSIGGKWVELLKEAAPQVSKVAIIFNAEARGRPGDFASIDAAIAALSLQGVRLPIRDAVDVVRGIDGFAAGSNGGLLVLPPPPNAAIADAIRRVAAEHRLPSLYGGRSLGGAA
jgi:putative tryptophan/tyrosine transport system substrate-binding protein